MTAPLTPPDCDLQDFPFMPLHVARLRDSDLAAEEHPEACWYAVMLWSAAWHQLPAGSLPDNETVLARLCGLGRDLKTFRRHRAGAMRGFVLCDDGRLYHPVIAEQAVAAWEGKKQQRWRSECARIKKANQRNGTSQPTPSYEEFLAGVSPAIPDPSPDNVPEDTAECPSGQTLQEKGKGTGTGRLLEETDIVSDDQTQAEPPKRRRAAKGPPEFEAAWSAYPHVEGRSSKPNALEAWKALPSDEQSGLVAAIQRFKPKVSQAHGDRGAPCMARWLRDGKHLNWLVTPAAVPAVRSFDGPENLFTSVVRAAGQEFADKWIAPCRWRASNRTLIALNTFSARRIEADLERWLIDNDVRVEASEQSRPEAA